MMSGGTAKLLLHDQKHSEKEIHALTSFTDKRLFIVALPFLLFTLKNE